MADYYSRSFQPNDATADEAEFDDTLFNVRRMRALRILFMQYVQRAGKWAMKSFSTCIFAAKPRAYVSLRDYFQIWLHMDEVSVNDYKNLVRHTVENSQCNTMEVNGTSLMGALKKFNRNNVPVIVDNPVNRFLLELLSTEEPAFTSRSFSFCSGGDGRLKATCNFD